jgi:hypothetical protein
VAFISVEVGVLNEFVWLAVAISLSLRSTELPGSRFDICWPLPRFRTDNAQRIDEAVDGKRCGWPIE